jgi:hypothetical protein
LNLSSWSTYGVEEREILAKGSFMILPSIFDADLHQPIFDLIELGDRNHGISQ